MDFWAENKTKILGTVTVLVGGLLGLIVLGAFDAKDGMPALLDPNTVRWMNIVLSLANMALGGGTIAVGVQNSTAVRVAESQATVASAQATTARQMAVAVNTMPGGPIPVVEPPADKP